MAGHAVTSATGKLRVGRVDIAPCQKMAALLQVRRHIDCDLVLMSGGLNAIVHLHSQARGKLKWDETTLCFRPSSVHEAEQSIGAANGTFDLGKAVREAGKAAQMLSREIIGCEVAILMLKPATIFGARADMEDLPDGYEAGQGDKAFVDYQNDVTSSDIQLAVREGYHSVEHVKRYTTTGMATDQGKTSNINALVFWLNALRQ